MTFSFASPRHFNFLNLNCKTEASKCDHNCETLTLRDILIQMPFQNKKQIASGFSQHCKKSRLRDSSTKTQDCKTCVTTQKNETARCVKFNRNFEVLKDHSSPLQYNVYQIEMFFCNSEIPESKLNVYMNKETKDWGNFHSWMQSKCPVHFQILTA